MKERDMGADDSRSEVPGASEKPGSTGDPKHASGPEKAAQRHVQQHYRIIFNQSRDAIVLTDATGTIIEANQPFLEITGVTKPFLKETNIGSFFRDPDDFSRFQREIRRKGTLKDFEVRAVTKDNSNGEWLVKAASLLDRDRIARGYLMTIHDRTALKKTVDTALRSDQMKVLAEMAGAAAHNFKNLLQIIVGGTRLALSNLELGNLQDAKSNLEQILSNVRFAADTARLLNHFAYLRSRKTLRSGRVLDLSRTVQKAMDMSKSWLESDPDRQNGGILIDMSLERGCMVKGVQDELLEVVLNLIWNAADAMPSGGKMTLNTRVEKGNVILQVRDTGVGIPEESLDKVFQPFWTTKGLSSSGLGLAASYGIVAYHGGEISVESDEGEGTTFIIKLPLAVKAVERAKASAEGVVDFHYRILVVDDLEPLLKMLCNGLSKRDQIVFSATSGEEALQILANNQVDAVICDLAMPKMNGWQVGRAVKEMNASKGLPKLPFIILTGWGRQIDEKEKMEECGVDRVVEKPVDVPRLLEFVRDLVQLRDQAES